MSLIPGINVAAAIAPFDTADNQATHKALYGQGGLRTVANIAARNAIPSSRLEEGMGVYVQADQTTYRLLAGYSVPTVDANWAIGAAAAATIPPAGTYGAIGTVSISEGKATAFDVSGNYAYVGTSTGYLVVVDITDPSNPVKVGSASLVSGSITAVRFYGQFAYVCDVDGNFAAANFFFNGVPEGFYAFFAGTGIYSWTDMALWGSFAYLTDSVGKQVVTLDLTSLADIRVASSDGLDATPRSICVHSSCLMVAASDGGAFDGIYATGFLAINPTSPNFSYSLTIPNTSFSGICTEGRYAYVSEGPGSANNRMYVIDVYDVTAMSVAGSVDLGGGYPLGGRATVAGRYVCLAVPSGPGLGIDVNDPTAPVRTFVFTNSAFSSATSQGGIYGGLYLLATGSGGTGTLDLFRLQAFEIEGITAASGDFGAMNVRGDQKVDGQLSVKDALAVGRGGITTDGNLKAGSFNETVTADQLGTTALGDLTAAIVPAPDDEPLTALAGVPGNVDNGDHAYVLTYITGGGGETLPSTVSIPVTVANKTVDGKIQLIHILVSTVQSVVGRRIYRQFNGTGPFKLVVEIADNYTTTYLDNKANASLGAVLPTVDTSSRILGSEAALTGSLTVGRRLALAKGTVAAANDLTLPAANLSLVSGNTQVNAIATASWTAGSMVTLIFSGTPTVKHNTAGGAGTARIFLSGSTDLVCAANTVLGLVYDGTQWQEFGRKVA